MLFRAGTKAFLDTFGGMIPCVVQTVHKPCNGRRIGDRDELTVKVTETRAGYRKGEVLNTNAVYTPPQKCRFLRGYQYRINTNYEYTPCPTP